MIVVEETDLESCLSPTASRTTQALWFEANFELIRILAQQTRLSKRRGLFTIFVMWFSGLPLAPCSIVTRFIQTAQVSKDPKFICGRF